MTDVRLNLGAGDDRRDGWISVDLRPEVADVVCDVRKLEHWGDGEVDELLANDLLEHFPHAQTADILAEWHRVLRPGGKLTLKVPNMSQLCRWVVEGFKVEHAITNIMGGHRWGPEGAWDTHHWNFTPETLARTLDAAGFDVESNDLALNMTVTARRR